MALDVITYDKVDEAEKNLGNKIDGLNGTVEGLPEEVQNQLDAFKATIDELKKNVEDTLADVQETVEKAPAGVPAPAMLLFKSESAEDGIKVTYRAQATTGANDASSAKNNGDVLTHPLSITKGVMVRYSEEKFPTNKNEGVLGFVDEDIYDIESGSNFYRNTKEKSQIIAGLTNNKTYYISAFPYSTYNAYNTSAGTYNGENSGNRTKCQWTGTKGTLTINVTQDYNYKPLGEYTATLTPTAGGQAITKTQSGAATIVFSGLEAGEYTLSFSAPQYFTAPQSQSVTVIAGQSQTISAQYVFTVSLNDLSWLEINEFGPIADKIFSVGDTKDDVVGGETLTFEIVGFKHDPLADGSGNANITFGMKHLMAEKRRMNSTNTQRYDASEMKTYLTNTFYNNLSEDLKSVVKSVKKKTNNGSYPYAIATKNYKIWLFSEIEVFGKIHNSLEGEGSKYEKFTTDASRVKKMSNGAGEAYEYFLRSPSTKFDTWYCIVTIPGSYSGTLATDTRGVCVGFCV